MEYKGEKSEKHADNVQNTRVARARINIDYLSSQIDTKNDKLIHINDLEDNLNRINKKLNECVSLLSVSMKGKRVDNLVRQVDDLNAYNVKVFRNLDEEREKIGREIHNIEDEKDAAIKELDDALKELENEESHQNKEEKEEK